MESAEILFWHSFIHLATTLQKRQQKAHGWQRQTPTVPILTGWQGYALFSALSLFGGVLIGFLFGHLF